MLGRINPSLARLSSLGLGLGLAWRFFLRDRLASDALRLAFLRLLLRADTADLRFTTRGRSDHSAGHISMVKVS